MSSEPDPHHNAAVQIQSSCPDREPVALKDHVTLNDAQCSVTKPFRRNTHNWNSIDSIWLHRKLEIINIKYFLCRDAQMICNKLQQTQTQIFWTELHNRFISALRSYIYCIYISFLMFINIWCIWDFEIVCVCVYVCVCVCVCVYMCVCVIYIKQWIYVTYIYIYIYIHG